MSRKTAVVVEEFDDDTDLPLPAHLLPNTGTRGPLLEQLGYDNTSSNLANSDNSDDDMDLSDYRRAGPASPPRASVNTVDSSTYKTWTCVYPIYLDAKRPYGTGQRRVARPKSLWWPLSKDIADAANRLGLGTLHEVSKSHPRDWENPGRVRVQWKKDGRLVNPIIKSKKQLLETICFQVQMLKPENIPKPPYNLSANQESLPPSVSKSAAVGAVTASAAAAAASTTGGSAVAVMSANSKGKQAANASTKSTPKTPGGGVGVGTGAQQSVDHKRKKSGRRLPIPPDPLPPLTNRVSAYSPAISTGILVETVKAGMSTPEAGLLPGASAANAQKGKRKVVRVRG